MIPAPGIVALILEALRAAGSRQTSAPSPSAQSEMLTSRLTLGPLLYAGLVLAPLAVASGLAVGALLDDGCSALLVSALTVYVAVQLPPWLAWRVLGPRGRLGAARRALRLAFYFEPEDREGAARLFAAAFGEGWQPGKGRVTFWQIFALALQAEREGDPLRADFALEGVRRLGSVPHLLLRTRGLELLAWPAVRRRDWQQVLWRLELGRGRGVRLLRLLARAHLGTPVAPATLRLAWLLAPDRRATLPCLREVLEGRGPGEPALLSGGTGGVWLRHLRLLADAAAGEPVRTERLEALAADWSRALEGAGRAALLARGLELGVNGVELAAAEARRSVVTDLQALASVAEGPWSGEAKAGLVRLLRSRQVEDILADLEEASPSSGGEERPLDLPLVELDRWLRFRRDFERLAAAGGPEELLAAWMSGLRYVCNWPYLLDKAHGREAAWLCREIHLWCAAVARGLGDDEIHRFSSAHASRY
jgi:hypothetical protein